jgi:hypothetical protein
MKGLNNGGNCQPEALFKRKASNLIQGIVTGPMMCVA